MNRTRRFAPSQIARMTGVSKNTVHRVLHRNGVKAFRARPPIYTEEVEREVIRRYTEAGVTERQVLRVLADRQALGQALLDRDPIDVVKRMATQLQASVGDFEAMAYAYGETHPSAAVGAKKGADQAREKLLVLLQATGRMPKDIGGLGDLMGMRELAGEMVDVVRAFKAGDADADAVEATFVRALGLGAKRPELTESAS